MTGEKNLSKGEKNLSNNMTYEETLDVFDPFYSEITFHFDEMKRKYTIDRNMFIHDFAEYWASQSEPNV